MDQKAQRIPTLAAYRRRRAVTVAGYTWLDLVEVSVGIDLPETVRRLSSFRDLRDAASEYVGLCNDLWSLERGSGLAKLARALTELDVLDHAADGVRDVVVQGHLLAGLDDPPVSCGLPAGVDTVGGAHVHPFWALRPELGFARPRSTARPPPSPNLPST
ncbi:terpene synthase family protein [Streptomyces sp. NPDC058611]|uniref:terpene synthase family protein n=1 Tax=unclassified Streptomyces TaxID=2593676 RepID=UPI0036687F5D